MCSMTDIIYVWIASNEGFPFNDALSVVVIEMRVVVIDTGIEYC